MVAKFLQNLTSNFSNFISKNLQKQSNLITIFSEKPTQIA
ncbi:hypothetical protein CCS77_1595 [Campylobacter concisus]|uniref:Uncharacterized protein n=1 Tax=Campylobacter concisus TaxID=199 RepID=A0A2R4P1U1_9BACT|nr:hypothetical protein CCS77_1595 [Campylobacter concisus]